MIQCQRSGNENGNSERSSADEMRGYGYKESFDGRGTRGIPDTAPVVSQLDDWREFRAKLVASTSMNKTVAGYPAEDVGGEEKTALGWAHVLTQPESGCLLLANPLMFTTSQTYFNKAVILLFSHGPDGSAGVILNKPTQHTMGHFKETSTLDDVFDACRLYLGGDVGADVVNLLHGFSGLMDSTEVLPGVYMGGLKGIEAGLKGGAVAPSDVKFLTRYAGWGPAQLQEEVNRGVWIVAAASKEIILADIEAGKGDVAWHQVLQSMGGEYADLSAAVKEEYRPDIMDYKKSQEEKGNDESMEENEPGETRSESSLDDFGHGHGI